jgi:thioredoxin reductase
MATDSRTTHRYDVAVIGGGPAGLSAAMVLGRCLRRVIVIDHGKGRNYAAREMHGYLGRDCTTPAEMRQIGRREAAAYGVEFLDGEVAGVCACGDEGKDFEITINDHEPLTARKLLLATGVMDVLPAIDGLTDFYGQSVHHCPYCDGWEHRGQRLVALGDGKAAIGLALSLRTWSLQVTACLNGQAISRRQRQRAQKNNIACREQRVVKLAGSDGQVREVHFEDGPPVECDAVFFSSDQVLRSKLPLSLGCECDEHGLIRTKGRQGTGVRGMFLAGDADGDVQFAIVATAEGAVAAVAINRELQDEERGEPRNVLNAAPLAEVTAKAVGDGS